MPKIVDQIQRKNEIATATWRVILEKGIDKASIQQIADEANMSVGLVQHHFSSKNALIYYAMNLVLNRMEERAKTRTSEFKGTKEEALRRLMKFIIPSNKEEMLEGKVWITFLGISFSSPKLIELRKKMDNHTRYLMGIILDLMEDLGYVTQGYNRDYELEILYGFIDGLVIHVLQKPELYPEEKVNQLIEYYLIEKKKD
ncbi:TetR/AcrR family transcriptional regulator [Bacillus cereus group sp. Sample62]|uniref:TetR/AcrR family transcriptional regulator n=1 Tax=Bacillus cereus group TaxID=86661 RepID=UPI00086A5B90|nr:MULTISPECIES: TetR/AcrR family transcriptional regulator [Bacillus cereus group]SCN33769.1 Transcriptional regulator, TetR [Bacillus cereus]HDR4723542.1 TetR/AcrR family transcriptional regulator [Bacillus cereus]HDR4727708.1 TetR/AcrR family transcriptional regulator [Bacillus cereus]HDX9549062.1 TetR/AcrR family transcriptional regulator [Bacillus thuringiensis]